MLTQDAVNKLNQQYGAFDTQQKAERQKQKFQHELQMKPGLIRPRGIEGSEPAPPQSRLRRNLEAARAARPAGVLRGMSDVMDLLRRHAKAREQGGGT
jgi:hypothetical protein